MEFIDTTFNSTTVQLDGNSFTGCQFNKCDLVFSGLAPVNLVNCVFNDCTWRFDGPASNTLGFLFALYHSNEGGRNLVEGTFSAIRKGELLGAGTTLVEPS